MKKITLLLCTMLSGLSLTACAQKKGTTMTESEDQKILVAYFSATGTTRHTAGQLAEVMGADLHEIKPETAYTSEDLNWNNPQSRSSVEMHNLSYRPPVTGKLENMADYDVVFVGFPIWWYTAPTIINTFMESYDFKGKTIIPFATSGGSTIQKSCDDLKQAYPDLNWKPGRLLNSLSRDKLESWKKEFISAE